MKVKRFVKYERHGGKQECKFDKFDSCNLNSKQVKGYVSQPKNQ